MNKKAFYLSGVCCIISILGFTQTQNDSTEVETLNEVVITDSKFKLKRENSGKVITKITQNQLLHLQGKSIAEVINTISGIEINGIKSNAGQNLSYFIRGGRNRQVLILIDGIAITDPSQIANDYDLRLLNADQVDSIEILKGASSTLYGTGAATAVINIKLKEPSENKFSANFRSVMGTNMSSKDDNYAVEDFKNSVSLNGSLNHFNYSASFGNQYTNGLSAVSSGSEPDAFNAINGQLKFGYKFTKNFKVNIYGSFDEFKADFDDGFSSADADYRSLTDQYRIGLSSEYLYDKGSISMQAAYNNIAREIESSFPSQFSAESIIIDVFNRYKFNKRIYSVLGVNVQQNKMENFIIPFGNTELEQSINPDDANFSIIDPYINAVFISEFGMSLNAGVRLNNHSEYGSHIVYSINPSFKKNYSFGYLKGLVSYSTAYITPSLFQLFEPTYGNIELQPEENATFEVGAELSLKKKARISFVYFNRNEKNFIDFIDLGNFVFQYNNVNASYTASGIEFEADYNFTKKGALKVNATYTKVEEDLNLRIPEIKINARLEYQLGKSTFASISYQFNDERLDSVYNSSTFMNDTVTLHSYSLIDAYLSHKILNEKLTLFVNISNILNEDYQELINYSTRGRNMSLGFNLNL